MSNSAPRTEKNTVLRVRRSAPKVNASQERVPSFSSMSGSGEPPGPGPLLSLRSAFILGAALLASACSGLLTYLTARSVPGAFLAAGSAFVGAVALLNGIISN